MRHFRPDAEEHILVTRQPFFEGMNKSKLIKTIQDEIANFDFNEEFESQLISDLIAEKHYYCSGKQLRPARFRKTDRGNDSYDFWGFFQNHGWHVVSWRQCINPRNQTDWLVRALRDAAQPIVSRYKSCHPVCERCQVVVSDDVDHVSPEFNDIATEIIGTLSPEQTVQIFERFDWWDKEPFSLPPNHVALEQLERAHRTARLQAVCKTCHGLNARERRTASRNP